MRLSSRLVGFCAFALAVGVTLPGCAKNRGAPTSRGEPTPSGVMELEGTYRYLADAGLFEDCATGVRWPVAEEADSAALERAYLASGVEPSAPLLVTVHGRLALRPKPDGPGQENVLIVEKFGRLWPRETCGSLTPARLDGVKWGLLELYGAPIEVADEATAPYLELNASKKSAYGFGGCNRFFGAYEVKKHQAITFSAIGATRMACPVGSNQEQTFFNALTETTRYAIHGSKLLLYAGDKVVARFEARNLLPTQ